MRNTISAIQFKDKKMSTKIRIEKEIKIVRVTSVHVHQNAHVISVVYKMDCHAVFFHVACVPQSNLRNR